MRQSMQRLRIFLFRIKFELSGLGPTSLCLNGALVMVNMTAPLLDDSQMLMSNAGTSIYAHSQQGLTSLGASSSQPAAGCGCFSWKGPWFLLA